MKSGTERRRGRRERSEGARERGRGLKGGLVVIVTEREKKRERSN